jgi:hypothetical protein
MLNSNVLTTCARNNSKRFFFFFNDDCDMSNEDVEDQDLEELSNEDEIAQKKGQVCCALKFCAIS